MFKRLKQRLQQMRANQGNTWSPIAPPTKGRPPSSCGSGARPNSKLQTPSTSASPQPSITALRSQLIQSQNAEEMHSQSTERVRIIPAGTETPGITERRRFTDEGLVTENEQYFLSGADGRLIKNTELHGGGRCSACGGYTDRIYYCEYCRLPYCHIHIRPWKQIHVCHRHWAQLNFNRNTWSETDEKK